MAPFNGTAGKSSHGGGRRPSGHPKPVVPAIPLPYLQRQVAPPSAAINDHQPEPQIRIPEEESRSGAVTTDNSPTVHLPASTPSVEVKAEAATPAATPAIMSLKSAPSPSPPSTSKKGTDTPVASSTAARASPRNLASPTPTRRRISPHFHPPNGAHKPAFLNSSLAAEPGPVYSHISANPVRMHHPHPSNGSLIFGGFYDSNSSSPAPHSGGGFHPPNIMSYPADAMSSAMSSAMSLPALDGYGLPLMMSPTVDGYPPAVLNHHGPPTPHSFHGSQSSVQADDNVFAPYSLGNGHSGHNGFLAHPMGHHPARPMASMDMPLYPMGLGHGPTSGFPVSRLQTQTLSFLRDAADHPDLVDCTLKLHLIDASQPLDTADYRPHRAPLVIPCHRLIVSQSPTLKHLLLTRGTSPDGVLPIEVQDQYMRSDAFYYTIRALYGWDFDEGPLPANPQPQSIKDGFELALGYAAVANYLQLPLVHAKAIRQACHGLSWETIEDACRFALPTAIFGSPTRRDPSSPGESISVSELLDSITAFVVNNISPEFVLDTRPGDCGFCRLPFSGPAPPSRSNMAGIPATRNGVHNQRSSISQGRGSRKSRLSSLNPRLSQIQFGDLSPENTKGTGPGGQVATSLSPRSPSPTDAILSRILLNLPFSLLKQILEHPGLAKASGELSPTSRQELISSIVGEREARRARVLERGDPQLQVYQDKLDGAVEPMVVHQMGDFMVNSMGFKEEVYHGDYPYLVQTWVHSGSGNISS